MSESLSDSARVLEFVRAAAAKGADEATIALMLRDQGWSERKIQTALVALATERLGLSAPARGGRSESAREAFFYLLSFALLGTWAVGLVWLTDILIDRAIPDPLSVAYLYGPGLRSEIAGQLASVLVAFPLFLWVNVLLHREIAARPETLDSGVRKWLTYVALVVTAGCLVGDVTTFLATYLGGGLTASFAYKAVFLLILSSGVFAYYLGTIRATTLPPSRPLAFGGASVLLVGLCVGVAFFSIGTPAHERSLNADSQRVADLTAVANAIYETSRSHAPPASLASLRIDAKRLHDPMTSEAYGYRRESASRYELCATFEVKSAESDADGEWSHPSGTWCFHILSQKGSPKR